MKRTRHDNSAATSSTRSSTRMWSRGTFGASALLATAMLLLSFAHCANATQPTQNLREWNARWAVLSATLGDTFGGASEAQTRVQGEQLWRWMQSRVAVENTQNLSPQQVARWLHEYQTQSGIQTPQIKATNEASSTRFPQVLASQLPQFPQPQTSRATFATRDFVASLSPHAVAKLSGVRTNRSHE